jgi:hypothetical protein
MVHRLLSLNRSGLEQPNACPRSHQTASRQPRSEPNKFAHTLKPAPGAGELLSSKSDISQDRERSGVPTTVDSQETKNKKDADLCKLFLQLEIPSRDREVKCGYYESQKKILHLGKKSSTESLMNEAYRDLHNQR